MPRNSYLGAFVLFYDYVRLDAVGSLRALDDFLAYSKEFGLEAPITYQLYDPEHGLDRPLSLTPESMTVWNDLKENGVSSLDETLTDPSEWMWLISQERADLVDPAEAGEEFVVFNSVSMGIPYRAEARSQITLRESHKYMHWGTRICVSCMSETGNIQDELDLTVDRPSNLAGQGTSGLCTEGPCGIANDPQGELCLKYSKEAGKSSEWRIIVTGKPDQNNIGYRIRNITGTNPSEVKWFLKKP